MTDTLSPADRARYTSAELDEAITTHAFCEDPFEVYRRLRDEFPLFWSEAWGVWVLTRHDHITDVLRDDANFLNSGRFATLIERLPAEALAEVGPLVNHYRGGLLHTDPPRHTRLRTLVRNPFTARAVAALRDRVAGLVDELVSPLPESEPFDLVPAVSYPLPVTVICDMLGVPEGDRSQVGRWSDELSGLQSAGAAAPESARIASRAAVEMEEYFGGLAERRRAEPGDDLMSAMVAAREGEDRLSGEELMNMATTFLVAGHETTKNLISTTVLNLLRHPDALAEVRRDSARAADAVEETLRYEGPIQRAWRLVGANGGEAAGRSFAPGELVFLMLGSANRDPEVFAEPDVFDLDREDKGRHIAFGFGAHFCLGAHLGRLEATAAVAALFERFDSLEPAGPVAWNPSIHLHGPVSMPLIGRAS